MNLEWLENLTKPIGSLLNPVAQRIGGKLGHRKPHLYVHFVLPQTVWCIARNGDQEAMQIVFWADFNHDDPQQTLIITDAYPKGTRSEIRTVINFPVPPGQMVREQVATFAVPIKGEKGKPWTGRIILLDQFKRKYKTDKIAFRWVGAVTPPAKP
jgi:hypothetical protein